jgi:hypothetical protein
MSDKLDGVKSEMEYVEWIRDAFKVAFDGDPDLVIEGLCTVIALLINSQVISEDRLKDLLDKGWQVKSLH